MLPLLLLLLTASSTLAQLLGCFLDGPGTLGGLAELALPQLRAADMTPTVCSAYCANLVFSYAGLVGADACVCGDQAPAGRDRIRASHCERVACAGNAALTCGSGNPQIVVVLTTGVKLTAEQRQRLSKSGGGAAAPDVQGASPTPPAPVIALAPVQTSAPTPDPPTVSPVAGGFIGAGVTLTVGLAVLALLLVRRKQRERAALVEREEERGMVRASHYAAAVAAHQQHLQRLSRNTSGNSYDYPTSLRTPSPPEQAHLMRPSSALSVYRRGSTLTPHWTPTTMPSDLPPTLNLIAGSMESLQDALDYAPKLVVRNADTWHSDQSSSLHRPSAEDFT